MTEQLNWLKKDNTLQLSGKLNQNTLFQLWKNRFKVMQGITTIDLNEIKHTDTAGIALLIHLVKLAKQQNINVIVIGINENILTLSKLYNLPDDILPIDF